MRKADAARERKRDRERERELHNQQAIRLSKMELDSSSSNKGEREKKKRTKEGRDEWRNSLFMLDHAERKTRSLESRPETKRNMSQFF
jgi:hypothetical protein